MRPLRYRCVERGRGGDVGVLVGGDVYAGSPRRVDLSKDVRHPAPTRLARYLEVPDLHRDACFAADAERLVEGLVLASGFVADVAGVDPAVAPRGLRQRDQLFGGRVD